MNYRKLIKRKKELYELIKTVNIWIVVLFIDCFFYLGSSNERRKNE